MKKGLIIVLAIVGVLLLYLMPKYNKLVNIDEDVNKAWSGVQTQYQRRADVFLSQLEVVKAAAKNEKDILIGVAKARAGIQEAKEGMKNAQTPTQLNNYLQQAKSAGLALNVQIERYPDIKSNEGFLKFQDEIAGTENRIQTARDDFNSVVTDYNKKVRSFPTLIFARIFGFDKKDQFEADNNAQDRPELDFNS
jgi:LemA protein